MQLSRSFRWAACLGIALATTLTQASAEEGKWTPQQLLQFPPQCSMCQSPPFNSDTAIRWQVPIRVAQGAALRTLEDFHGVAKSAWKLPHYLGRPGLGALPQGAEVG
jgi:hypothetical protein